MHVPGACPCGSACSRTRLRAFELVDGTFQPVAIPEGGDFASVELGCVLRPVGAALRVVDQDSGWMVPSLGDRPPSEAELRALAERQAARAKEAAERADRAAARAELEAARADRECARAREEAGRAAEVAARLAAAEAELVRVRAELQAARRQRDR